MATQFIRLVLAGMLIGAIMFLIPFFIIKVLLVILLIRFLFGILFRHRFRHPYYGYHGWYESISGEDPEWINDSGRRGGRTENREIKIN